MDVSSGISAMALEASSRQTGDAVTISTMKKAMDIQKNNAMALISSIPSPTQGLPDNLGRNLNVVA